MSIEAPAARATTTESLLGLLSLGPLSGYEIRQLIDESIGNFWTESFGQIYPTLKRMAADGLVSVEETPDGKRRKKTYSLTDPGRERLREWLAMPVSVQVPRNELLLKLFFGNRGERSEMQRLVETRRDLLTARLARLRAIEQQITADHAGHPALPFWLMTVRYGTAETTALLGWCKDCLTTFKEMS